MENKITRDAIVKIAREWLGTPYHHQASSLGVGCDCLGLIRGIWRSLYGYEPEKMPAYTSDWAEAKGEETLRDAALRLMSPLNLSQMNKGDCVLFRWRASLPAKHIALLSSKESFIHACEGQPVSEVYLSPWWQRRIHYAFQFPNLLKE